MGLHAAFFIRMLLVLIIALNWYPSKAQGHQSVYLELGGNGLFISGNFDARFTKKENGFGFRMGLGMFPATIFNSTFITIPVGLNHLAGKAPHHLESGMGLQISFPGIRAAP